MVNFDLSPTQHAIRSAVRSFASTHLKTARSTYEAAEPNPAARFRSTQPVYAAAVQGGLISAQIPAPLGGTGGALIDAAVVVEEMYAVETSASLTILGTGLGLTPVIMGGESEEVKKKWLEPFLKGEGTPLASLAFSEPAGSANFAAVDAVGFGTVAVEDGDEFVISGEKASSSSR
jgi:nitroalkane oxidase